MEVFRSLNVPMDIDDGLYNEPPPISDYRLWYNSRQDNSIHTGVISPILFSGTTYIDNVNKWDDLSGNNDHLIQATDSKKPYYGPLQKRLLFNRANAHALYTNAFSSNISTNGVTVFTIYHPEASNPSNACFFHLSVNENASGLQVLWAGSPSRFLARMVGTSRAITFNLPDSTSATRHRLITMTQNSSGLELFVDRTSRGVSTAAATQLNCNKLYVGKYAYEETTNLHGFHYDILVYPYIMTSTQINDTWDWFYLKHSNLVLP